MPPNRLKTSVVRMIVDCGCSFGLAGGNARSTMSISRDSRPACMPVRSAVAAAGLHTASGSSRTRAAATCIPPGHRAICRHLSSAPQALRWSDRLHLRARATIGLVSLQQKPICCSVSISLRPYLVDLRLHGAFWPQWMGSALDWPPTEHSWRAARAPVAKTSTSIGSIQQGLSPALLSIDPDSIVSRSIPAQSTR